MKNKIKIIIPIIVGVLALAGIGVYTVLNGTSTLSSFTISQTKAEQDETGIDWSTYTSYDIELSNESISIKNPGVYNISGTLSSGNITINTNGYVKLILKDASITSKNAPAIYVIKSQGTYIALEGDNKINAKTTTTLDAAIYSKDDLYFLGNGSITIESNQDGIAGKDDLYFLSGTYIINSSADGIKGKDTVTMKDGTYTITAKEDGIKTTNTEEKGNIIIENGTFKITANQDGIQAESTLTINDGKFTIVSGTTASSDESQKGLKANQDITINNGTFTISAIDDAIHSNTNITINKGTYELSTNDDGIHADSQINIKDGNINITKSYEGIESYNITISGGTINVIASDDGINIGGGNDSSGTANGRMDGFDQDNGGMLTITGGNIYVNADGDGLDSNGGVKMTGGNVYVDGPTNNGNGALDYNGTFVITGGELIAVGSSGMVQNVSSSSTQNTILVTLSSQTTGDITLGNITYSPKKSYQSILISSASLQQNVEYTLTAGSTSQSITLTSTVSQSGASGGMMNGGGRMNNGMRGQH